MQENIMVLQKSLGVINDLLLKLNYVFVFTHNSTFYYRQIDKKIMKNIRIIKENIDVSAIAKQLESYPEDWGNVGRMKGTDRQDPHTRLVKSGVLQLYLQESLTFSQPLILLC